MRLCVFAYQFPHFKTEYGLKTLIANGFDVALVVAQPFKKLKVARSKFRISPALPVNGDVEIICAKNGINYLEADHDSLECLAAIRNCRCEVGLILGARILKLPVIQQLEKGILNIHPGAIPENRGLDNFKWAIIEKLRMANTAHLIDDKIDMGSVIQIVETDYFGDDTIFDFYLRHFFSEFVLMIKSLEMVMGGIENPRRVASQGTYFGAVPDEIDENFQLYFEEYKAFRKN